MVLVVVAHPDDEVLTCGAYLAHLAKQEDVFVLYATFGSNILNEKKARFEASQNALEQLGINKHQSQYLDFKDQTLNIIEQPELNIEIENAIEMLNPRMIITHTDSDFNTDHIAVNNSVKVATRQKNITVLFFESPYSPYNPNNQVLNYFFNAEEIFDKKRHAVNCYCEFLKLGNDLRSLGTISYLARLRGNYINCKYAEAFTIFKMVV